MGEKVTSTDVALERTENTENTPPMLHSVKLSHRTAKQWRICLPLCGVLYPIKILA